MKNGIIQIRQRLLTLEKLRKNMGDYKEFDETLLENGVLKNKLGITDERELRKKGIHNCS